MEQLRIENHLIKINSSSVQEIADLYGIGFHLAEKIIEFRDRQGYFRGPEDLAKVEGVDLNLALTLSPHIDWEIPVIEASPKRDRLEILLQLLTGILVFNNTLYLITTETVPSIKKAVEISYQQGYVDWLSFVSVCARAIQDIMSLTLGIVYCIYIIKDTSQSPSTKKNVLLRIMFFIALLYWLLFFISGPIYLILLNGQIPSNNQLFGLEYAIISTGIFIAGIFVFLPVLIIAIWPQLLSSRLLGILLGFAPILGGITLGITIWLDRNVLPWPLYIPLALMGVLMVWIGLKMFRMGNSLVEIIYEFVQSIFAKPETAGNHKWQTWINFRLPNPDDQKELQRALIAKYPPSRMTNLLAILIISIGGWITLTILASIIDWIVQGVLNKFIVR